MSFQEVADALTYLQEKTHDHSDIIPGVINNDQMEDRAQVILIITGLGATPVESPFTRKVESKIEQTTVVATQSTDALNQPLQQPVINSGVSAIRPSRRSQSEDNEYSGVPADIDIPAFLRRRVRVS